MFTALLQSFLSAPEKRPSIGKLLGNFKELQDKLLKKTTPQPGNMLSKAPPVRVGNCIMVYFIYVSLYTHHIMFITTIVLH